MSAAQQSIGRCKATTKTGARVGVYQHLQSHHTIKIDFIIKEPFSCKVTAVRERRARANEEQ